MANTHTPGVTPTSATPDELDVILGSLDIDAAEGAEVEEIVENEIEELEVGAADDDELRALEVDLTKAEVYETAEAPASVAVATEEKVAEPAKTKKAKTAKSSAPKLVRDLSALPASAFLMKDGNKDEDDKSHLIASRPKQKKIAEKFDTTIAALAAGRKPSTYVMDCFKVLNAKKSVSSTDLVAALRAEGYTDGTARSQVGQIMTLFPLLGIADRTKGNLEIRLDSVFGDKLRSVV